MIKKFFRDHSMHRNIAKYFDFLFLFNLPYFFILLMLFCWGMSASYYSKGIEGNYYFFSATYTWSGLCRDSRT